MTGQERDILEHLSGQIDGIQQSADAHHTRVEEQIDVLHGRCTDNEVALATIKATCAANHKSGIPIPGNGNTNKTDERNFLLKLIAIGGALGCGGGSIAGVVSHYFGA